MKKLFKNPGLQILVAALVVMVLSILLMAQQPSNVVQLLVDPYTGIFYLAANGVPNSPIPFIQNISGTAYTNATTGFTAVKGGSGSALQWNIDANQTESGICTLIWQASAATAGPDFEFTGPGSPTLVIYNLESPVTTTTTITPAAAVAFSSSVANSGTVTTATNFAAELSFSFTAGPTAGTVALLAAANGSGTLTIQPGSFCIVQ